MTQISDSDVHQTAYTLLLKVLDSQPEMLTACPSHGPGGKSAGEFLNGLYDQLLVLSRKYLSDGQAGG